MTGKEIKELAGKALVDEAVSLAQSKIAENIVVLNPGTESGIAVLLMPSPS